MNTLVDQETSLTEMVDSFVNYKLSKCMSKFDNAVQKMKSQIVCDSDMIMAGLIEPTYLISSIQDKLILQHRYLIEPFRQTYALSELKNAIVDKLSLTPDYS